MAHLLEFEDVSKRYGSREILAGVSFAIGHGEALGLVGVNGAGKTTLIRGLLDLIRINGGRITIDGLPHTITRARAGLSYLAERFNPPPFATGIEFLRHIMGLHQVPFERAQAESEAAALDLDIDALDRPAREYSKGMAQKLGLIAAILPATPALVLDEPLSGLDPKARVLVKARLGALRDAGRTLFFSTHLLADVDALCDRIAVLNAGSLAFLGTPRELQQAFGADDLDRAFLALIESPA